MNLHQLFCKHIYRIVDAEFLRETCEMEGYHWGVPVYSNFRYIAEHQRCVKCKKTRTVEKKYHSM